jgi:four helix bundle protein
MTGANGWEGDVTKLSLGAGMKNNSSEGLFPFQKLDVYRVARELVVLVERAGIRDRELRDQATRAAKSVLLRLCEGLPHFSQGMRRKYFAESLGSLHELMAAVDVAAAIGAMDEGAAKEANELGFRVRNMIGRLK